MLKMGFRLDVKRRGPGREYPRSPMIGESGGPGDEAGRTILKNARRATRILTFAAYGVLAWGVFWPRPYALAIWAMLALPIIALVVMRSFSGAVTFDTRRRADHPTIAVPFMMPCLGLALRAAADWNILSWAKFWKPWAVFSVGLFLAAVILSQDVKKKAAELVLIVVLCAAFGFGTAVGLNGILDRSPVGVYKTHVLSKWISSGRSRSCYIKLSPWKQQEKARQARISQRLYNALAVGEEIYVGVKAGAFGIPWFFIGGGAP